VTTYLNVTGYVPAAAGRISGDKDPDAVGDAPQQSTAGDGSMAAGVETMLRL
jgi:hypothetical protein